ncbi:MAG: hypothetical protein ACK4K0_10215 [Flavobacteriales bacterium]
MRNLIYVIIAAIFLIRCNNNESSTENETTSKSTNIDSNAEKKAAYQINNFYNQQEKDTLLVDLVSYIYRKPAIATWQTKLNPEFRSYFIKNAADFNIVYYHISEDSTHYYYLLRPARDPEGKQKRGVGGMFKRNGAGDIIDFEELFNTPIHPEAKLKEIGFVLFEEIISNKSIDRYLNNKEHIEWPDGRLFYSKEKKEWRYVD